MVYQQITILCDLCENGLRDEEVEYWNKLTDFLNKNFPQPNSGGGIFYGNGNSYPRFGGQTLRPCFIDGNPKNSFEIKNLPSENQKPVKWVNNYFREYCFKCILKEYHGIPYNHRPHIDNENVYYFHLCKNCFESERFRLLFPYQHSFFKKLEHKVNELNKTLDNYLQNENFKDLNKELTNFSLNENNN